MLVPYQAHHFMHGSRGTACGEKLRFMQKKNPRGGLHRKDIVGIMSKKAAPAGWHQTGAMPTKLIKERQALILYTALPEKKREKTI